MVAIPNVVTIVAGLFGSLLPGMRTPGPHDLSTVTIPLSPAQQTALGLPTTPLVAVGLGFGVQNYTCSANNVFVSAGAVAELFDISCLASTNNNRLSTIHNDLFNLWNSDRANGVTIQQLIASLPDIVPPNMILSQHYFITNAAGGISPVWDFRATQKFKGVPNAVFVGKALANTPDASPTKNVAWLHVGKVSGDISDEVYRIYTVGGVAPPSCVSGTTKDISVKYVSQYWFYGGSLGLGSK
jgi:hypothetical protein